MIEKILINIKQIWRILIHATDSVALARGGIEHERRQTSVHLICVGVAAGLTTSVVSVRGT